ncbi:hypothetical protein O6P43_029396 [Quillaja saponaria]|uniref:Uncharacterized protein n=1 Tax=Quillaja saponaria TaxID=32244 RepID=A0AAD7L058_QUISA|nr:hypothetical protein O6P43_029396 [Quillaja saponaria]
MLAISNLWDGVPSPAESPKADDDVFFIKTIEALTYEHRNQNPNPIIYWDIYWLEGRAWCPSIYELVHIANPGRHLFLSLDMIFSCSDAFLVLVVDSKEQAMIEDFVAPRAREIQKEKMSPLQRCFGHLKALECGN